MSPILSAQCVTAAAADLLSLHGLYCRRTVKRTADAAGARLGCGIRSRATPDQRQNRHRTIPALAIKIRTEQMDLPQRAAALAVFNKLVAESFTILGVTRCHIRTVAKPYTSPSRRSMAQRCIRSIDVRPRPTWTSASRPPLDQSITRVACRFRVGIQANDPMVPAGSRAPVIPTRSCRAASR